MGEKDLKTTIHLDRAKVNRLINKALIEGLIEDDGKDKWRKFSIAPKGFILLNTVPFLGRTLRSTANISVSDDEKVLNRSYLVDLKGVCDPIPYYDSMDEKLQQWEERQIECTMKWIEDNPNYRENPEYSKIETNGDRYYFINGIGVDSATLANLGLLQIVVNKKLKGTGKRIQILINSALKSSTDTIRRLLESDYPVVTVSVPRYVAYEEISIHEGELFLLAVSPNRVGIDVLGVGKIEDLNGMEIWTTEKGQRGRLAEMLESMFNSEIIPVRDPEESLLSALESKEAVVLTENTSATYPISLSRGKEALRFHWSEPLEVIVNRNAMEILPTTLLRALYSAANELPRIIADRVALRNDELMNLILQALSITEDIGSSLDRITIDKYPKFYRKAIDDFYRR
jgi:hypothetical protein